MPGDHPVRSGVLAHPHGGLVDARTAGLTSGGRGCDRILSRSARAPRLCQIQETPRIAFTSHARVGVICRTSLMAITA